MRKTVRAELNRIEKFLLKKNFASRDLWAVLTALRGPDVDKRQYGKTKEKTTAVIRTKAFPKLAVRANNLPATFARKKTKLFNVDSGAYVSTHFQNHIDSAERAFKAKG